MLQDFYSVSDHFGTLCMKWLMLKFSYFHIHSKQMIVGSNQLDRVGLDQVIFLYQGIMSQYYCVLIADDQLWWILESEGESWGEM